MIGRSRKIIPGDDNNGSGDENILSIIVGILSLNHASLRCRKSRALELDDGTNIPKTNAMATGESSNVEVLVISQNSGR